MEVIQLYVNLRWESMLHSKKEKNMITKAYKIKLSSVATLLAAATLFSGCSDQFLEDKQQYGKTTEVLYNNYEGAKARVGYLYSALLPSSTGSIGYLTPSAGSSDDFSKCTEEYGGLSKYVDPNVVITNTTNLDDYIYQENKTSAPYGRIRECNDIIEGISGSSLTDEQKKELLGQAYFFRAWCYYQLVKIYGGIPIVDYVQNPVIGDNDGADLIIPRATTKECIDFICQDLRDAADRLPARWTEEGTDYGRVTAGTALALQGRARLLYASPLFNRADDRERWQLAYNSNKAAVVKLAEGGFGLAYLNEPGVNGSGWARMFAETVSSEAVFVTLYNNLAASTGTNYNKNNGWEQSIRPKNTGGSGKSTTVEMIDLFPMADGMRPSEEGEYSYNKDLFFLNRDPRFYRTFAFPGVRWAFAGDPTSIGTAYPYAGTNYVLWSYAWYKNADEETQEDQTGYGADGLGNNNKSVYIRKRTDDADVNSALYNYDVSTFFAYSAAPYMEIRYAEVLLNLAESACGIGEYGEAIEQLRLIRQRAGYTGDALTAYVNKLQTLDRGALFEAILYERQIELAYEGKRFDDMRRWMLWDGGVGQETLNSSWKLTGFDGNTCTYLGVPPLNGQRRNGIEIRVTVGQADEKDGSDPLITKLTSLTKTRPAALNLKSDIVTAKKNISDTNKAIDNLADFYSTYLVRKTTRVDGDPAYSIKFQPQYYFLGFKDNMQKANITLKQTIGWGDYANGGNSGTYDPLAE